MDSVTIVDWVWITKILIKSLKAANFGGNWHFLSHPFMVKQRKENP